MFRCLNLRTAVTALVLLSALATGCTGNSHDASHRSTALPEASVMPLPELSATPATTPALRTFNPCKTVTLAQINDILPAEGGYTARLIETGEYVIGADPTYAPVGCDFSAPKAQRLVSISIRAGKQSLCDDKCTDPSEGAQRRTIARDYHNMVESRFGKRLNGMHRTALPFTSEHDAYGSTLYQYKLSNGDDLCIDCDDLCINCTDKVFADFFFVYKGVNYLVGVSASYATPDQIRDVLNIVIQSKELNPGS